MNFNSPHKDARLKGLLFKDIPIGISTVEYIFEYDCAFNGAALFSDVSSIGSSLAMETQYTIDGGTTWLRYKKFAKGWNLFPNYVCKTIMFPTMPKAGIKLLITVDNKEGGPINIGMNMFTFTDLEKVSPSLGEQGVDW